MIAVLPEILFADSEQGTQEIEAKPKKQFDANFIKAHFPKFRIKYPDSYYTQAVVLFLTSFTEPIKKISELILTSKKSEVEPLIIVDDTEDEEEEEKEQEEEEEEKIKSTVLDLVGDVKKIGLLKAKLIGFLSTLGSIVLWPFKWLMKKFGGTVLKWIVNLLGKIIGKIFIAIEEWIEKMVKKYLRPLWRRVKARFWKIWRRTKRFLLKIWRKCRRIWKRVLKFLAKHSRVLLRIIKKLGVKLLRILVKVILNVVASGLTASGVGSAVGLAIFVAMRAWDAYEVYSTAKDVVDTFRPGQGGEEESEDIMADTDEDKASDVGEIEGVEGRKEPKPAPQQEQQPTQLFQAEAPKPAKTLTAVQKYEGSSDEVSKALEKYPNYSYQIISKLYRTYKITAIWLLNMQEFTDNVLGGFARDFNKFASEAQKKIDTAKPNDWQDSEEYKKIAVKDTSHVKKPHRMADWNILVADNQVKKLFKKYNVDNGRDLSPLTGWWRKLFIDAKLIFINKYTDDKTRDTENKISMYKIRKHEFETGQAYSMAVRVTTDLNVEVFDFFDEMEDAFDYREKKIVLLKRKNKLMYFLYNVIAWWNDSSIIS